jgi:hypothetical protein
MGLIGKNAEMPVMTLKSSSVHRAEYMMEKEFNFVVV